MPVSIDIILPCYNPNTVWVDELIDFYARAKDRYVLNFILVNDGSASDLVVKQVEALQQQHIPLTYISYTKNRGKGYALRQGVADSQQEFIVYTDIDFPFTVQSMQAVMEALSSGACDIAAGYRNEVYYQNTMSFYRKVLSKSFRFFIRKILGMAISDTQCGLKGFNKKGKEKFMRTSIDRYLFDFEFIYTGSKDKSLKIKAVEVQLKEGVTFSKMKLKILVQEAFNLLYILLFKRNK